MWCYSCWFKSKAIKRPAAYLADFSNVNLDYPVKKKRFYRKRSAFEITKDNDLKRLEELMKHVKEGKPPFYYS